MSTTSLKLPDALKRRAAAAAEKLGISPHAFMVDAIASAAERAERRASFVAEALAERKSMYKSGKGFAAEEVHAYLKARASGKPAARPRAKSWRR